MTRKFILAI